MELKNYLYTFTEDGSPSLRLRYSPVPNLETGELMHHQGGALSETFYIYQPCLDWALRREDPRVLSVGLGLGYNEMLAIYRALEFNKIESLEILSYEKDEFLRESFKSWFLGNESSLNPAYDLIALQMGGQLGRDEDIKIFLTQLWRQKRLLLAGTLSETSFVEFQGTAVLFDAFSQKTSPGLWTYDFLKSFMDQQTQTRCAFATYASTTLLKQVLNEDGFTLHAQKGFAGKRESTFATRDPLRTQSGAF